MPNDGSPERRPYSPADAEFTAAQIFDPVAFAKRLDAARAQREEALARRRERADAAPGAAAQPSAAGARPRTSQPPTEGARPDAATPPRNAPVDAAPATRPALLPAPEPLVAPSRRPAPRRRRDAPRSTAVFAAGLIALGTAAALTVSPDLRDGARGLLADAPGGEFARGLQTFAVDLAPASTPSQVEDAFGPPVVWATASAPGFQPGARGAIPRVPPSPAVESAAAVAPVAAHDAPPRLAALDRPPALGGPEAPSPPAATAEVAAIDPLPPIAADTAQVPAEGVDPARPPTVEPVPPRAPTSDAGAEPTLATVAPMRVARTDPTAPVTPVRERAVAATSTITRTAAPPAAPVPAVRAPQAPGAAAPPGAISIAVHAPPSLSEAALANAVASVDASGFQTVRGVRVGFPIGQTHVRYFHGSDLPTARRLAAALGGGAGLRDFTFFKPPPIPGRLEIWLSGGDARGAAASPPPAPARVAPPAAPAAGTITSRPLAPPSAPVAAQPAFASGRPPALGQARASGRPTPAFVVGRRPLDALSAPPPPPQEPAIKRLLGQVGIGIPPHDRIRRE